MEYIHPYKDLDSELRDIERVVNTNFIIHRIIHNGLYIESKFNIITKYLYLDLFSKSTIIRITVSCYSDINGIINWSKQDRPILKTYYSLIQNIDELSVEEINLLKIIIYDTLKICREKKYIKFDTDKDFRRQISLSINRDWYKYPG